MKKELLQRATKRKEKVEDKMKRINLMSKRKKTLLKKAMEMSQMFSLDVLLIIQDDHMNKII